MICTREMRIRIRFLKPKSEFAPLRKIHQSYIKTRTSQMLPLIPIKMIIDKKKNFIVLDPNSVQSFLMIRYGSSFPRGLDPDPINLKPDPQFRFALSRAVCSGFEWQERENILEKCYKAAGLCSVPPATKLLDVSIVL